MIFGAGFSQVGGSTGINGLVSGVEGTDYGDGSEFMSTAAQLQIPATVGYKVYYYLNDGYYVDENDDDAYKPGWCDDDGNIVDVEITPGIAFWFKSVPGNANCVVAGEVASGDSYEIDCPANFALRANPFPMTVKLNSDKFMASGLVNVEYGDGSAFMSTASQIQIPATVGYKVYYYLTDGYYVDENDDDAYKPGWCDDDGNIVDAEIPIGQGIWTKGVSSVFKITFNK